MQQDSKDIKKENRMKNAVCKYPGCDKLAYYNYLDEKYPAYCTVHKDPSMLNIRFPKR